MKKVLSIIAAAALAAGTLTGCGSGTTTQTTAAATEGTTAGATAASEATTAGDVPVELKPIIVGASTAPHAEILAAAKPILAEQGYDLQIKEYTDYVLPNMALDGGDLDANYFQHNLYLEQFCEERGTKLTAAATIHYEPFGIYAGKASTIEELADKAKVAVPNDATNEARALLLLEAQGLIKLKEDAGLYATKNDIVENPKNLEIVELEAAQIPRSLPDVEIAVINGNYAIAAGLNAADALAVEDSASVAGTTYGNVVAVQTGRENDEVIVALIDALSSEEVKAFIEEKYQGAVVPLF